MNREFDYSELIEDYLTGKLSEKQRLELEAQLEINPDLKKDFMLQKDIISSIKEVRKAELKSMLNNVNLSSGSGFNYFPIQIVGAILITSLIAVGTYFYFTENENSISETSKVSTEITSPENGSTLRDTPPVINNGKESNQEETIIQQQENNENEESTEETPATSSSSELPEQEIITESPAENSSTSTQRSNAENVEDQPTGLNVETKKDRNHAFHYQFYEDKLFLYGDFKGNAYEIIKLPTTSGIKLYMSYDGRFYKLEKSRKIKGFERVEDPVLIEQLQKLKTK